MYKLLTDERIKRKIYENDILYAYSYYDHSFIRPVKYYISKNNMYAISIFILIKIFDEEYLEASINYTIYSNPLENIECCIDNYYNFLSLNMVFDIDKINIFETANLKTAISFQSLNYTIKRFNEALESDLYKSVKITSNDVLKYL